MHIDVLTDFAFKPPHSSVPHLALELVVYSPFGRYGSVAGCSGVGHVSAVGIEQRVVTKDAQVDERIRHLKVLVFVKTVIVFVCRRRETKYQYNINRLYRYRIRREIG